MNNITKDTYHIHNESWTCGDGCCFNDETYVEKNGIRYKSIFEDNWSKYEDDMKFLWDEDVIEFILQKEFNIKIALYITKGKSDSFFNSDNDYLLLDWYDSKWFDDYFYILDRKDYLDNLELKGLNKDNIITNFKKRKEPSESYNDLFKKITGTTISYSSNYQDNTIDYDDD